MDGQQKGEGGATNRRTRAQKRGGREGEGEKEKEARGQEGTEPRERGNRRRRNEGGEAKRIPRGPQSADRHQSVTWVRHSSGQSASGCKHAKRSSEASFSPMASVLRESSGVSKKAVLKPTKRRRQKWAFESQYQARRVQAAEDIPDWRHVLPSLCAWKWIRFGLQE